jgi:hypothetical protein
MSSKLLEVEGVILTRFARGRESAPGYEMDTMGNRDAPLVLTLDQLEGLARELPFIVEQERGGDSTGRQDRGTR